MKNRKKKSKTKLKLKPSLSFVTPYDEDRQNFFTVGAYEEAVACLAQALMDLAMEFETIHYQAIKNYHKRIAPVSEPRLYIDPNSEPDF